jgi:hypothetical protein
LIRIGRKKHFDAKRLIQSVFSVSRSMTIWPLTFWKKKFFFSTSTLKQVR